MRAEILAGYRLDTAIHFPIVANVHFHAVAVSGPLEQVVFGRIHNSVLAFISWG